MAILDPVTKKFLCECGCNTEINSWCSWACGHHPRTEELRASISKALTGIVRSEEFCRHTSEGVRKAYRDDPTYADRVSKSQIGIYRGEEFSRRCSEAQQKVRREDPTINDRISETLTGYIHSDETRQKMSESHLNSYKNDPTLAARAGGSNLGRIYGPLSAEHRQAISEGQLRSFSEDPTRAERQSETVTGRTFSEEHKYAISEGVKRAHEEDPTIAKRISDALRKHWEDPDFVKKMALAWNKHPNSNELELENILDKNFPGEWKFVGNFEVVIGRRNPDFININGKKLVLELFSDWWHFENARTGDDEEDRITHYKKYGYRCLVIWDDELFDEDAVVDKVKELLNQ